MSNIPIHKQAEFAKLFTKARCLVSICASHQSFTHNFLMCVFVVSITI